MTSNDGAIPSPARALAPDLARGMMLLLIAIANVSIYLWGHETLPGTVHPVDGSALDGVLSTIAILFVDARVYPMFAFLFGYGMVQFAASRAARGVPERGVRRMLRRRHLWLIVFGLVHAALLFAGDILGAYGLAGLILVALLFRRTDRTLGIVAGILTGLLALSALLALVSGVVVGSMPVRMREMYGGGGFDVGGADLLSGTADYGWSILNRLGFWALGTVGVVIGLVVPACILLGWLAARHRWLEIGGRPRLGPVAVVGIAIGVLGAVPQALIHLELLPFFADVWWAFSGVTQLTGMAGGIGYAALFALVAVRVRDRVPTILSAVAAVGKRSLTSYLLQSVVFAPLLTAWGLGLGARIGTATAFAIAAGVWLLSVLLAVLLERRGMRGPAEALLRRLTYGRGDAASASPASPPLPGSPS